MPCGASQSGVVQRRIVASITPAIGVLCGVGLPVAWMVRSTPGEFLDLQRPGTVHHARTAQRRHGGECARVVAVLLQVRAGERFGLQDVVSVGY